MITHCLYFWLRKSEKYGTCQTELGLGGCSCTLPRVTQSLRGLSCTGHYTLHTTCTLRNAHLHQHIVSTQQLHPMLQCTAAPAPQCAARPSALRSASALLPHITPQPHQITARPPAVQPSSSFCNESISLQCASTFLPLVMLKSFKESTVLLLLVAMRPGTEFIIKLHSLHQIIYFLRQTSKISFGGLIGGLDIVNIRHWI